MSQEMTGEYSVSERQIPDRYYQCRIDEKSFWENLKSMFKLMAGCCWVSCPPFPSFITRKVAFHPAPCGHSYKLFKLDEDGNRIAHVKSAKEIHGEKFEIAVKPFSRIPSEGYKSANCKHRLKPFTVQTSHGSILVCTRVEPSDTNTRVDSQVVLFCQPNASDIGDILHPPIVGVFTYSDIWAVDIYIFDYTGYGYSTGKPSEKNMYNDVRAVYAHIRETRPDATITLVGFSIGTAAAVNLASERPAGVSALVLVAPFTSGIRLLTNQPTKPQTCSIDAFKSIDKIELVDVPTLIIHGTDDINIPPSHGLELHRRLKRPLELVVVPGATHSNIMNYGFITIECIRNLIESEQTRRTSLQRSTSASPCQTPCPSSP